MLVFKVGGMTCGGCVGSVKRAVNRTAPDARVNVDLAGGTVTVSGAPEIPEAAAQVIAAIQGAGFYAERLGN